MTVNGSSNIYMFGNTPENEDFELHVVNDKGQNAVYGLSCCSIIEVIGILIQDYATGIITDIKVE